MSKKGIVSVVLAAIGVIATAIITVVAIRHRNFEEE